MKRDTTHLQFDSQTSFLQIKSANFGVGKYFFLRTYKYAVQFELDTKQSVCQLQTTVHRYRTNTYCIRTLYTVYSTVLYCTIWSDPAMHSGTTVRIQYRLYLTNPRTLPLLHALFHRQFIWYITIVRKANRKVASCVILHSYWWSLFEYIVHMYEQLLVNLCYF